jgi:DNA topoisomerase IA
MPTTEQHEQKKDLEKHKREALYTLIGEQVLHILGKPADLHKVTVRRLWEDRYRVNVLVGKDATSVKIANSYFVDANDDGNIIESNPRITKQY